VHAAGPALLEHPRSNREKGWVSPARCFALAPALLVLREFWCSVQRPSLPALTANWVRRLQVLHQRVSDSVPLV